MGIRFPLKTVLDYSDGGTSSIATGTAKTFIIPQDTDNVVVKLSASIIGGGVSVYLQTTDNGGTTWYDIGRTSVVSADTQWLSAPVISAGQATGVNKANSIISAAIGSANASTVGIQQMTGLPVLSSTGRVVLSYSAAGTSNTTSRVEVKVNSESGTA